MNINTYNIGNQRMIEFKKEDDYVGFVLSTEGGYNSLLEYESLLCNLNYKLISVSGLTDMTRVYILENSKLSLEYDQDNDMICIFKEVNTEEEMKKFKILVYDLQNSYEEIKYGKKI